MHTLEENELYEVNSGGVSVGLISAIIAGVIFLIGAVEGYVNPQKCNN